MELHYYCYPIKLDSYFNKLVGDEGQKELNNDRADQTIKPKSATDLESH